MMHRKVRLRRQYDMNIEQYDEMLEKQNYGCLVCGREENLHIDHCHETGRVRAILCGQCNQSLGLMGEDPNRIRGLALYAETMCSPTVIASLPIGTDLSADSTHQISS